MKLRLHEFLGRGLVPIAGLTLAAYYLFVLRPITQRAKEVDEPLQKAWQRWRCVSPMQLRGCINLSGSLLCLTIS